MVMDWARVREGALKSDDHNWDENEIALSATDGDIYSERGARQDWREWWEQDEDEKRDEARAARRLTARSEVRLA